MLSFMTVSRSRSRVWNGKGGSIHPTADLAGSAAEALVQNLHCYSVQATGTSGNLRTHCDNTSQHTVSANAPCSLYLIDTEGPDLTHLTLCRLDWP